MIHHLYILKSQKDGTYYIGSTSNLEDRLKRHFSGRSVYTRSSQPWELVYTEGYETRLEAQRREREIKSWKSRKMIEKLKLM